MRTYVINLYGGPGCGKSTLASELFYKMKRAGESVELVREYAKDWAYEDKAIDTLIKQTYILAKQAKRESALYGKVQYIITDCPLHLSGFYGKHYLETDVVKSLVKAFIKEAHRQDVWHQYFQVPRNKAYVSNGRFETEEQAIAMDQLQRAYFRRIQNSTLKCKTNGIADEIIVRVKYHRALGETQ
jgi:RecA/RadA recombinase